MQGFGALIPARRFAESLGVPYWIAGGWAIDLFVGTVTRGHGDVDVLVLDRDQDRLRELWLEGLLVRRHRDEVRDWPPGERLEPGPDLLELTDASVSPRKLELLIGMTRGDDWVWHRGKQTLHRPLASLGQVGPLGLPYVAPEVSLMTRARHRRDKDDHDFRVAVATMSAEQKRWLLGCLLPDHPWRDRLGNHS